MRNEDAVEKLATLRAELALALGMHELRDGKLYWSYATDFDLVTAAYNARERALCADDAQWKLGIAQEQAEAVGKDLTKAEARIAELEAELKRRDEHLARAQANATRTGKDR